MWWAETHDDGREDTEDEVDEGLREGRVNPPEWQSCGGGIADGTISADTDLEAAKVGFDLLQCEGIFIIK